MRFHGSVAVLGLALFAMTALSGCGGSDGPSPAAASIGTSGGDHASSQSAEPASRTELLHPVVVVETSLGEITLKLDAEAAPGTVSNFLHYLNSSHYDQTLFHYVENGSMVLGGGFTVDGTLRPTGPPIRNEAHNGLKNKKGTIAMSRSFEDIDSATSQFFINAKDNSQLDHAGDDADKYGYCVFGEVIEGMNVVEKIAAAKTHDTDAFASTPVKPIVIRSIHVVQ